MRMGFGKKKIDMDEMTDLLEQLSQLVERKSNEINASITDLNKSMEDVKSSLGNIRQEVDSVKEDVKNIQEKKNSEIEVNRPSVNDKDSFESADKIIQVNMSRIVDMYQTIRDIDYNVRIQNNSISQDYVQSLLDQINEFKKDLFLKLMRLYFCDIYSNLYRYLARLLFKETAGNGELKREEIESLVKILEEGLNEIGINAKHSKEGQIFNCEEMDMSENFPRIQTTDENRKGKIALSIVPQFYINFPSLPSRLCIKYLNKEEVVLYED